jgi:acetolactate synthase-1/2/3 large subunit
MREPIKASLFIAEFLYAQGVSHVFEVVGGMITHLIDSIHVSGNPRLVSMHHEQAAAFAADAMGRMTGVPGVAMATSGPGATNLLTGIGSSYFDSSPTVFITGQVNRGEQKGDRSIRQLGFQETDIVAMASPVTKAAWRVQSVDELPARLAEAFALARTGRPGPVLLDIPMDVQREKVSPAMPGNVPLRPAQESEPWAVEQALDALRRARRPLILVGGGVQGSRGTGLLRRFAEAVRVPVVCSLLAVDALPYRHPLRVGMIGSYGNRWANLAIGQADLLLIIGSRLDVRQTGSMTDAFKGDRVIYHVDCEAGEINNRVKGCTGLVCDARSFLGHIVAMVNGERFPEHAEWIAQLSALHAAWPDTMELNGVHGINPNQFMHQLSACSRSAAAYVTDVGQHQMWAAQSLELEAEQRFLTSGGMGAMGFGLPAAIGTSLACPNQPVVMIAGDGGFQLNIQELQTVVRNRLPLKLVVLNNQCHGMVRQFQESYFDGRYPSTSWGYSPPDFARVAQAYGIEAGTVENPSRVHAALQTMWRDPKRPYLLQVMIAPTANAYPKIAFGHPITEMEPQVKPVEMEGT